MVESPVFQHNPRLYVFLPAFYTIWEDAVLTPSEIRSIQKLICEQAWLSEQELTYLNENLSPTKPPAPSDLKSWLEEIQSALPIPSDKLADIGIKLAQKHGARFDNNIKENLHHSFGKIEQALGLIDRETAFQFFPQARETDTSKQTTQGTFDESKMTDILDGDQAETIRRVLTIVSDPEFHYVDPSDLRLYREKVLSWARLLARQGFGAAAYPEEYGGENDMAKYFTIMETLSYHDLSLVVKFGVQFGLFGMSILFLGTRKHHDKYLKAIGTLDLPGCFAMTETGHGSNVRGIETTATYHHDRRTFMINTPHRMAQKEYIGNAAVHGRMATVFAKLIVEEKDYGVAAFVVPIRRMDGSPEAGIEIEDCGRKMGLNGVDNGVIRFHQVEIPVDQMLDRYARISDGGKFESSIASDNRRFFTMLGTLVGGRIGIPRAGLSAAKSGLTIAIRYGDQRLQFGPDGSPEVPILNYRTHQRRLMPLLANAYAIHFALRYLTERFLHRKEEEMQEIEALAAGLKAYATWNTTTTLQECRECCGGKGYLSENRLDTLKSDTEVFTTFEGDNTVLLQLVAKSRLTEFRHSFGSMNLLGIVNYVAAQAKVRITELNPVIIRNTSEDHLLDTEFHLNAFRYREEHILSAAARRIKNHLDNGMDSFDAFNQTQSHLVQVGIAFIERIILEQFQSKIQRIKDKPCKGVLHKLYSLFALSTMEKHKGWYLEHDYMAGAKTKAIRKLVNRLCWEIRQEAVPLVDSFHIPDACLAAPIGVKQKATRK